MKQRRPKKKLNNRGSVTVLVLVAMMFLGILGMAMLTMTGINIQMKEVGNKSQENFYDADSVLDRIRAGLADTSSEVTKEAYTAVMENYVDISEKSTLQTAFDEYYIDRLVRKLTGGGLPEEEKIPEAGKAYYYSESFLKGLLPENEKDCLQWDGGTALLSIRPLGNRSVILKNVKVVKTESTYETVLETDIEMLIPSIDFSQESVYPEYTKYAFLADDQIRLNGAQNVVIDGNCYSGTVNRENILYPVDKESISGLIAENNGSLKILGDTFISRGDIWARNGGTVSIGDKAAGQSCKVWVQNIRTGDGNSSGARLSIHGKTYVEDDLEMNGTQDFIKLSGSYYGYHYKKTYEEGELPSTEAAYSSAVLINGRNNTLNMEGLEELVIAGRTFISRGGDTSNRDILTGDSLSVKSSQMAYYVPKSFVTEKDGSYGLDIEAYEKYLEFRVKDYLAAVPLSRYYLQESGSRIYYYYLNFKNQEAAREFQKLYYDSKKEFVDKAAENYLSNDGITINNGKQMLLLSGNVLYREDVSKTLEVKIGNSGENESFFDQYGTTYGRAYKARQLGLVGDFQEGYTGGIRLERKGGTENSLFYRLVDVNDLCNTLPAGTVQSAVIESLAGDGSSLGVVWLANGDFTFDAARASEYGGRGGTGIILATGNVTLNADFEGMVLAGEDILLNTSGVKISANTNLIQEMFRADIGNVFVTYFKEKNEVSRTEETLDFNQLIQYRNWKKNGD